MTGIRQRLAQALDRQQLTGRIARNTGWLIVDKVVRAAVALPVGILITRYLGVDAFGHWSYALALVSIFSTVAALGLDGIVVRGLVHQAERREAILATAFALKLLAGAGLALLAVATAALLDGRDALTTGLVCVLAGALLFQALDVVDYWFQSLTLSRPVVLTRLLVFLAGALAKFGLVLAGGSLLAFAWLQLAEAAVVAGLLLWTHARHDGPVFRLAAFERALAARMLRDAIPLLLAGLAVVLYMRLDVLMLQHLASPEEVGAYAAATRLSEFWYAIPVALVASASPSLLGIYASDPLRFGQLMTRLYRGLFWSMLLLAALMSLLASPLVVLLYGEAFAKSGPVLALHVWTGIPVALGIASSQYLLAGNLMWISLARTLAGLVCNVVLNFLLIPPYGALGAAAATACSSVVATFSMGIYAPARQHTVLMLRALVSIR